MVVPPEIEPTDSGTNDVMTSEGSSIKLGCKAKGEIYRTCLCLKNSNIIILQFIHGPLDPGDPTPVVRWHREDGEDITMRTVNGERLRCNYNSSSKLHFLKSALDFSLNN